MAKIRSIKVEFWTSPQIVECSPLTRLLFIGIWNFCDDGGIHPYSSKRLKMEIFPADDEILSTGIDQMLLDLEKNQLIKSYTVGQEKYFKVTGWTHQKSFEKFYKYPNEDGIIPPNEKYPRSPSKKKGKKTKQSGNSASTDCQSSVDSASTDCQQTSHEHGNGNVIKCNGNDNEKGEGENADPPPKILYRILTAEGKYFLIDQQRVDAYVERFPNLNVAQSLAKIEGDAEAKQRWQFVDVPTKINWWLSEDEKKVAV